QALRVWLVKESHLQAEIEDEISTPSAGHKRGLFPIHPGPKVHDVQFAFDGAHAGKECKLREGIYEQQLTTEVHTSPGRVTELLMRFYQEQGYLDAQVKDPKYQLDPQRATGKVIFPVVEGPLFAINDVTFEGNKVYTADKLADEVPAKK